MATKRAGTGSDRRPPGRPRRMPIEEQRALVLEAARATFAAEGFSGTSIERVAKRAGVARPLVYELFGDKEALYVAVVDDAVQAVFGWIGARIEIAAGQPLRERIRTAVAAFFEFIEAHPDEAMIVRAVARGASGSAVQEVRAGRASIEEALTALIEVGWQPFGGIPHEAARVLALVCLASVEAVGNRQVVESGWPSSAAIELLTEMLFGGFAQVTASGTTLQQFE